MSAAPEPAHLADDPREAILAVLDGPPMLRVLTDITPALRAVVHQAAEWADLCPRDDWADSIHDTVLADLGRRLLDMVAAEMGVGREGP